MKIYVARHGRTNENEKGLLSGNSNMVQLIEEGKQHAINLANYLVDKNIGAIFCSPLDRAQDTARPCSEVLRIPIQTIPELHEFDFGIADGMPLKNAEKYLIRRRDNLGYKFPAGESYNGVLLRVDKILKKILSNNGGEYLLVGHGGINRAILERLTKRDLHNPRNLTDINQPNSILYEIDFDNGKYNWINTLNGERGEGLVYGGK